MIPIPKDFLAFLKLLNQHEVQYLLIGGYAVAYYGYVRATGDLDVYIKCSEENAQRAVSACTEFGLGDHVSFSHFLESGNILRFGLPPMRLEILNEISGVTFEECWKNKGTVLIMDTAIPVISLEDLLKNKRASGRKKDLLDLEMLKGEKPL